LHKRIMNMRNTLIGIFLFTCLLSINAQDKINLKNGEELSVFIIEKTDTEIKYQLNDSILNTIIFTTKLNKLENIHYRNGMVDFLFSKNPRSKYRLGMITGVGIAGGDEGASWTLALDYLFTPHFSAEINIRVLQYTAFNSYGGKYWFANKYSSSGFSPYVGFLYAKIGPGLGEIPIGLSYISKSGFQTALQVSSFRYFGTNDYGSALIAELRVGWRFKQ